MNQISISWVFFCFIIGLGSLIQRCLKKEKQSFYLIPLLLNGYQVLFYFLAFLIIPFLTQHVGYIFFKKITAISRLDLSLFLAFLSEIGLSFFLYFLFKKRPNLYQNLCPNPNKKVLKKQIWIGYCESLPLLFLVTVLWYYGMLIMIHYGLPITLETQPIIRLLTEHNTLFITKVFMGISIIILAPICEEIFFRGILLRTLNARLSLQKSLWLSAFIFALAHQHFPSFLPLLFLGYWLGYYYVKTGNLRTNIGIHALFNGTNFILIFTTNL